MDAIAWVLGIGIGIGLLLAFPRRMLILLGILAGIAGAVGAYWYVNSIWQAAKDRKLIASARVDKTSCASQDWPILVTFSNTGSDRLVSASFELEGYHKGHSGSVLSSWLSTDKILEPGDVFASCWAMPWELSEMKTDPNSLLWRVTVFPHWE